MEYFPCQNRNTNRCRVFRNTGECHEDVHHVYFPKRDYITPTEKRWRNLDENKELTCRDRHNEIHATQSPPTRPEIAFMAAALRRAKDQRKRAS